MSKVLTVSELLDQLWELFFVSLRSFALSVTAAIHLVILFLYTFTHHLLTGAKFLHDAVENWRPVRPSVFDTEVTGGRHV